MYWKPEFPTFSYCTLHCKDRGLEHHVSKSAIVLLSHLNSHLFWRSRHSLSSSNKRDHVLKNLIIARSQYRLRTVFASKRCCADDSKSSIWPNFLLLLMRQRKISWRFNVQVWSVLVRSNSTEVIRGMDFKIFFSREWPKTNIQFLTG